MTQAWFYTFFFILPTVCLLEANVRKLRFFRSVELKLGLRRLGDYVLGEVNITQKAYYLLTTVIKYKNGYTQKKECHDSKYLIVLFA